MNPIFEETYQLNKTAPTPDIIGDLVPGEYRDTPKEMKSKLRKLVKAKMIHKKLKEQRSGEYTPVRGNRKTSYATGRGIKTGWANRNRVTPHQKYDDPYPSTEPPRFADFEEHFPRPRRIPERYPGRSTQFDDVFPMLGRDAPTPDYGFGFGPLEESYPISKRRSTLLSNNIRSDNITLMGSSNREIFGWL